MAYDGTAVVASPAPRAGVRVSNRAAQSVSATSPIVRRLVLLPAAGTSAATHLIAVDVDTLQGYEVDDFDGLGFSLGKIVKNVGSAVKKAAVDTAHVTGKVVTSKAGKALIGGALALTGVGIPAAAAIGAATQGVGTLIRPGGNIGAAAKAGAVGAAGGVAASVVGKGIRRVAPNVTDISRTAVNKVLPGNPLETRKMADEKASRRRTAVIGPVRKTEPVKLPPVPDLIHLPVDVPPPPPLGVGPESKNEGNPNNPQKKPGTSLIRRASAAVERAKKAATLVEQAHVEPAQVYVPQYTPPGAATGADEQTVTPEKSAIGGIPPVVLAAGVVGLLLLMNRR
jgi:hypothetical protein